MGLARKHRKEVRAACNLITDVLEDAAYEGKVSDSVKEFIYLGLSGTFYDLRHPVRYLVTGNLKEDIRNRLGPDVDLRLRTMRELNPLSDRGATMSKGLVLERSANHTILEDQLKQLSSVYPGAFGYAVTVEGQDNVLNLLMASDLSITDLSSYLEVTGEYNFVGHFSTEKKGEQPFVLLQSEDDKPLLVAFIEGNLENYHDGSTSDEQNFVKDWLQPRVDDTAEITGGNLQLITKAMKKTNFAKDVQTFFGEHGCITFMNSLGDVWSIDTGSERQTFDWGSTSVPIVASGKQGTLDLGKQETVDKPLSPAELIKSKLAALKGKPDGVHSTNAKKAPLNDGDAPRSLKTDVDNATVLEKKEFIFPPEGACRTRESLKGWYNAHFGTCPEGYQLAVGHPEKGIGLPRTSLLPTSKYITDPALAAKASQPHGSVPAVGQKDQSEPVVGPFPIIDAKQKEIQGHFLKSIDVKSVDIMDPKQQQDIEKKASNWFHQHGETMERFMQYPSVKIRELVVKWPNDAQLLIESLRYMLAINLASKKEKEPASTPADKSQALKDKLAAFKAKTA